MQSGLHIANGNNLARGRGDGPLSAHACQRVGPPVSRGASPPGEGIHQMGRYTERMW